MRELSLFTGAGGGLLGALILGWRTVAAVERDPYCVRLLCERGGYVVDASSGGRVGTRDARESEGAPEGPRRGANAMHGCGFPIHTDIRTFHPIPGSCDIVTGGFPCQPHSQAGKRLGGLDDRDLWPDTLRVLRESQAPLGFFENVPGLLTSRDADGFPMFGRILGDLSEAGFDAEWCVLGADDVGAPHRRKRLWILAYRDGAGREERCRPESVGAQQRPAERGREASGGPWHVDPADVGHAAEFGLQGVRPGRQQESRSHAGPGLSLRSGDGQAVGDSRGRLCAGRAPEPGRRPEERAAAGRSGEGVAAGDDWLLEPYVGGPLDGLADELGRQRDAARERVVALASLLPSIPYAILHSWDNESQNSRRSASDAAS